MTDTAQRTARMAEERMEPRIAVTKDRFKLVPVDDIPLSRESRYIVKGVIPRAGLTVLWGPTKCGKSFWAFDAAMHVAQGLEYRGRPV